MLTKRLLYLDLYMISILPTPSPQPQRSGGSGELSPMMAAIVKILQVLLARLIITRPDFSPLLHEYLKTRIFGAKKTHIFATERTLGIVFS